MPAMGTVPTPQQSPVLPDASELVDRAAELLQHFGMTRDDALAKVMHVTANVLVTLRVDGFTDVAWLEQVLRTAKERREVSAPSDTEQTGNDHADGHSG